MLHPLHPSHPLRNGVPAWTPTRGHCYDNNNGLSGAAGASPLLALAVVGALLYLLSR
jgi:hypothetical protein